MKALIATDHVFLRHPSGVYDTYCFDYGFFTDYLAAFDEVEVASRIHRVESLPAGAFRADGARLHFIDIPHVRGPHWAVAAQVLARRAMSEALDSADATIVRLPSELGWLAAKAAERRGKPFMVELIGDPRSAFLSAGSNPIYRAAAALWAHRTRALVGRAATVSYVNGSFLPRVYPPASGAPWDVISSIRLHAEDVTAARDVRPHIGTLHVIHVGTMTPRKRLQDVIAACGRALDGRTDVMLHLVGDGPDRNRLMTLALELGIARRVVFHGHVSGRARITDLLDRSDLFVLPSASEGLPRAVVEAMARGVPVVAARTPGVDELVEQPESFAVGDVAALAELIRSLASDSVRLRQLSARSIDVARRYLSDVLSPKRVALYRSLLGCDHENRAA